VEPFTVHTGTAMPLRRSNVDTDQITPARFVPYFSRTGYANALFADWRDDPDFVLNLPEYQGATILVAGTDFATGSSRESAVWALQTFGFRAVIAPRYGDIFRGNSLMKGLLTVLASTETVERLWELVEDDPSLRITVDLRQREVRYADEVAPFDLDDDLRDRLLAGLDPVASTLRHEDEIAAFERGRRTTLPTTLR
jgi:3-isopropylmalate/(R)-2-methylmalate dehydratase small subunit